jgi:hypothetical protein
MVNSYRRFGGACRVVSFKIVCDFTQILKEIRVKNVRKYGILAFFSLFVAAVSSWLFILLQLNTHPCWQQCGTRLLVLVLVTQDDSSFCLVCVTGAVKSGLVWSGLV